jgi:hypothetical protein
VSQRRKTVGGPVVATRGPGRSSRPTRNTSQRNAAAATPAPKAYNPEKPARRRERTYLDAIAKQREIVKHERTAQRGAFEQAKSQLEPLLAKWHTLSAKERERITTAAEGIRVAEVRREVLRVILEKGSRTE